MCPQSVNTEAVFTKTEINNKSNINFLKNSQLSI